MIKTLFFVAALLAPALAYGASPTANLSVTVVPTTPSGGGNCPSSPPPPAQRAGFTTLAYCADFSDPKYATTSNWMDCNNGGGTGFEWWWLSGYGVCSGRWAQATDPATGKTVMTYQWLGSDSGYANFDMTMQWPNPCIGCESDAHNFPAGAYYEIRWRHAPGYASLTTWPAPDFWTWSKVCDYGQCFPLEQDFIEQFMGNTGGGQWNSGVIDWANNKYSTCCWGASGTGQPPGPATGYDSSKFTVQNTFAMLMTNNGTNTIQACSFINDVLAAPCGQYDGTGQVVSGTTHLQERHYLSMWFGGGAGDQTSYIEHIAVWSCAQWLTVGNPCTANGITQ